jgi:hypothetical protein
MHYLQILHAIAGFIVLIEAVNKLERTCPTAKGLNFRQRLLEILKVLAWFPVAIGSAGATAGPLFLITGSDPNTFFYLLRVEHPTLAEVAVMCGVAVMVVRTRIKENFSA